jgi:hypothetical protein
LVRSATVWTTSNDCAPAPPQLTRPRGHRLEHAGIRYVAGIGRFGDGRLAEVFLNGAKCGTDLDTAAKESAILASFALQAVLSEMSVKPRQMVPDRLSCPARRRIFAQGQVRAHIPYATKQRIFATITSSKNREFRAGKQGIPLGRMF